MRKTGTTKNNCEAKQRIRYNCLANGKTMLQSIIKTKDDSVTYIEKVFSRASNCLVSTMPILSIIQKYRFIYEEDRADLKPN